MCRTFEMTHVSMKSGNLYLLEPSSPVQGLPYLYLYLLIPSSSIYVDDGGGRYQTTTSYNRHNHRFATLKHRNIVTEFWFVVIFSEIKVFGKMFCLFVCNFVKSFKTVRVKVSLFITGTPSKTEYICLNRRF